MSETRRGIEENSTEPNPPRREDSSAIARRLKSRSGKSESRPQTAKFLESPTVPNTVCLGADGKLPELALESSDDAPSGEATSASSNPWIFYSVLAFSLLSSVGMLLIDVEGHHDALSQNREAARQELANYYGSANGPTEPYQRLLREALVEQSQGNTEAARRRYRQVMQMLNSVDFIESPNNGLTGRQTGRGPSSDATLRKLLETVIAR